MSERRRSAVAALRRRTFLQSALAAPFALSALGSVATEPAPAAAARSGSISLVPKQDFPSLASVTYLNAARFHPLPRSAAQALCRSTDALPDFDVARDRAAKAFADLLNADVSAIALAPSTMAAENAVLASLQLAAGHGNVVTDALHFHGSLYLYAMLARRGVEIRRVAQRHGRVDIEALDAAIDRKTRLVSLSVVSSANGFRHDVSAVCERAHAKGALVYADAIQAAGAVPIDVAQSRVDFCAAATHKWLMGGAGIAFLYVRPGLIEGGAIHGAQHGWVQLENEPFAQFSDDPEPAAWPIRRGARGQFEVGTYAIATAISATAALAYLRGIGLTRIQAHAQALAARVREALPRLGYECLSPADAAAHISAFRITDRGALQHRLEKANIELRIGQDAMRVSTSVFNDAADIDHLIDALS